MKHYLQSTKHSLLVMLMCVCLLLINQVIHINHFGIAPREISHLSGIIAAPFLHGSWAHLISNFFPFVIFSSLIGLHSVKRFWLVFSWSLLITGALVWLLARGQSIHIGLSGVVYAMWGYLVVYGIIQKNCRGIAISMLVLIVYGGFVFGVLPSASNISFESHLFGAIVGSVIGYRLAKVDALRRLNTAQQKGQ